jgi:predicted RND superfamily exporter protein
MRSDGELEYSQLYLPHFDSPFGDTPEVSESPEAILERRLAANPVFEGALYRSGDTSSTAILIQTDNDLVDPDPFRLRLVDEIRSLVGAYATVKNFSLAGNLVVNAELNRASQRDVLVFYGLITVLMVAFGWFTLRNFRDLAILFGASLATVVPTMGTLALLGIPFNMITVMLPTVLIALVVPDVIHAVHDFHRLRTQGVDSLEAARESTRLLWIPSFWKTATDVVGFASFIPSTVAPIMQMGIYASLGVTLGWLATISAVPLLLLVFWPQGSKLPAIHEKEIIRLPKDYLGFLWKYRLAVGAGFILLLLPMAGLPYLKVDTDYSKFFGKNEPITRSYDRLKELGYGQNPITISLRQPEGKTYGSEGGFSSVLRFESAIKNLPQVRKLLGPSDLLEQVDKAYNDSATSREAFANYGEAQVGQLLFLAELSGNEDLAEFFAEDKRTVQLVALTDNMGSKGIKAFSAQVDRLAKHELGPEVDCSITGTSVLWANMDDQVATTELWSLSSAGGVLIIIFFFFLRSFRLGLVGIFINAIPVAGTLGLMGFLDIRVNIATALIAGIALGIVVDNSLHVIIRMQAFVKKGSTWRDAINATLQELGSSMLVSGAIIIGSFSCLITSNFTPTREFGVLLSANVLLSLFLDFAALPALMYWVRPRKNLVSIKNSPDVEPLSQSPIALSASKGSS